MKIPHRSVGQKDLSGQADSAILSPRNFCPNTPDCRRLNELPSERAECRSCFQVFDRSELALIIAGAS